VIFTVPVLLPDVPYDFVTVRETLERPSVPLQEYEYVPVPPEAEADQTADSLTSTEDGDTEHEPARVAGMVTV
jgi:hypothetical protein